MESSSWLSAGSDTIGAGRVLSERFFDDVDTKLHALVADVYALAGDDLGHLVLRLAEEAALHPV